VPWSIEHSSCIAATAAQGLCGERVRDATLATRSKRNRSLRPLLHTCARALHTVVTMRQRKPQPSAHCDTSKSGPSKQSHVPQSGRSPQQQLHWCVPLSLLAVRLLSAAVNTVHDCDEVFNYWEPLHFLLHGYGLQTWENR
jgi:hypothetical protein